ncbi:YkgJ family cysteine cluster protein [bacterium]|nr:YkgJ family cysteine cluster protein [bacterium]
MSEPANIESLCLDCSFCCNGVLFSDASLTQDEVEFLTEAKFPLVERDGAVHLHQPCIALKGTCCSIYQQRPSRCRSYECELLKSATAGSTSWTEAHEIIAQVKELIVEIDNILKEVPDDSSAKPLNRRLTRASEILREQTDPTSRKHSGQLTYAGMKLRRLLNKHFLKL